LSRGQALTDRKENKAMEVMQDMTLEEMKQALIDKYMDLLRIKAAESGENKELNLQLKVTKTKMTTFSIDTSEIEKMFE